MGTTQRRSIRIVSIMLLILIALMVLAPAAGAFEAMSGDTIVIGAGEVIEDDLYVGASTFTLNGTIRGDLIVAGCTLIINGVV